MRNTLLLFLLLSFSMALPRQASGQDRTVDTSWTHEISVGSEPLMVDTLALTAANVPVYDAIARQLPELLQQAWPEATFKRGANGYKAIGLVVPALSPQPLDVHVQSREQPESGMLVVAIGLMNKVVPLDPASAEVKAFVHELGVRLNKAVVQAQIEGWRRELGEADRKLENTSKVEQRTQEQLSDASEKLERNRTQIAETQKAEGEARTEVQRFEQRWSAKSDAADLKGLSKANAHLAKEQERLADLLDEQEGLTERQLSRSEELPQATQKATEVVDQRASIMQIIAGLEHKRDSIR